MCIYLVKCIILLDGLTFDLEVVAELEVLLDFTSFVLSVVVSGTDVCRDLDVESLVGHCVPLAVAVDNEAVVDVDGIVTDKNVATFLVVERFSTPSAVVGDVERIALGDVAVGMTDLLVTAGTVVTIEVAASADVDADKDVGICVIEGVILYSHTCGYEAVHL